MNRYRSYYPRDDPPADEGDDGFVGVAARPHKARVSPGFVVSGRNLRFRSGAAETRRGILKPAWANLTLGTTDRIEPFGTTHGCGVFSDPNGMEWLVVAADGLVYVCREGNASKSAPLPAGAEIRQDVTFCQAFHKLFMFRGKHHAPLRLENVRDGFTFLVGEWSASGSYAEGDEFGYGPAQAVSSSDYDGSKWATLNTATAHGLEDGQEVVVYGAAEATYNGRHRVTVLSETSFKYVAYEGVSDPAPVPGLRFWTGLDYWQGAEGAAAITATSVVRTSQTAKFTAAAVSGLSDGDYVVVTGAEEAEYNGVFAVFAVDATSFSYTVTGTPDTPATGTIQAIKVTRNYGVMPNGQGPEYLSGRLVAPTWWDPSSGSYSADCYRAKRDYLAASNALDEEHFEYSEHFRVNQGAADELLGLAKLNERAVLAFKDRSVHLLTGLVGELGGLSRETLIGDYGACAERSWAVVGGNAYFVAAKRGVVSIRQTEQGLVQGVDLPLSAPIQPVIDRINWRYGSKARMAYWDNKLYVAVPLDDATWHGPWLLVDEPGDAPVYDDMGEYWVHLLVGPDYELDMSSATVDDRGFNDGGVLWATSGRYEPSGTGVGYFQGRTGEPIWSNLRPVLTGVNNAVLVYDFENQAWCGYDDGAAMCVKEFVLVKQGGVERLMFIGEDGYLSQMEGTDFGDQCRAANGSMKLQAVEIESELLTRGYGGGEAAEKRGRRMRLVAETWRPKLTVSQVNGECGVERVAVSALERSRTAYERPFDRAPYVLGNANNDWAAAGRGDYSVPLPVSNWEGTVAAGRMQALNLPVRVGAAASQAPQLRIVNAQGRVRILAVRLALSAGKRNEGGSGVEG